MFPAQAHKVAAAMVGMSLHPRWIAAIDSKATERTLWELLATIMYSLDPDAQFEKMESAIARKKDADKRDQKARNQWNKAHVIKFDTKVTHMNVRRRSMMSHMQQTMIPGHYYSLPESAGNLVELGTVCSGRGLSPSKRRKLNIDQGLSLDCELPEVDPGCLDADGDGKLFFELS